MDKLSLIPEFVGDGIGLILVNPSLVLGLTNLTYVGRELVSLVRVD